MVLPSRPEINELCQLSPTRGTPAGILTCYPFDTYMAVAECLGPSHPRTVLVAAESFSSSVVCIQTSCYFN